MDNWFLYIKVALLVLQTNFSKDKKAQKMSFEMTDSTLMSGHILKCNWKFYSSSKIFPYECVYLKQEIECTQ